jgi:glycosyltransferase involved in cell wall biosynthesis
VTDAPIRKPRVALVAHAYLEPTRWKNMTELARHVDLRVLAPARLESLQFAELPFPPTANAPPSLFRTYRVLRLSGAQFLLVSATLGLRRDRPCVLHVDYEPWSLIFWQVIGCRALFSRDARVVCGIKKNTYRAYPGLVGKVKGFLARAGIRQVARFFAASARARDLYCDQFGVPPDRVDVMTHVAVDVELFRPRDAVSRSGSVLCGYVGRLDEAKGVRDLVAAVARCRRELSQDVRLALLGPGPLRGELERVAEANGWLEVHEPVPTGEVPEFLAEVDVFVMPTRADRDHEEHDGQALLEALACGVPAIGTRSGIIPELLGDGTGLLVSSSDPAALSDAIAALASDEELRALLGRRGRAKAEAQFSVEQVARRKAEAYVRLCE